jgi:hypothetical protein
MRYILFLCLFLVPPDRGEPSTLHVKEVQRTEGSDEYGTWFHIKVTAESKTVVYVLSCDEFLNNKTGWTVSCYHVSAGKDYPVRLFDTCINFWPPGVKPDTGQAALYDILAEKEK